MSVQRRRFRQNRGMGKPSDEPWMNSSLDAPERVRLWLGREGTPLEFETASEFARAGFQVAQGIHQPQSEGLPLEIDVLAFLHERTQLARVGHDVIVECKVAPHPWVALAPLDSRPAHDRPIETELLEAARFVLNHKGQAVPNIWPGSEQAFGLKAVRGQSKEKDNAYDALVGVVGRARRRAELFSEKSWHITQLPMIVIGGDLCIAAWDEASRTMDVRSVDACVVDFRGDSVRRTTEVQVVTARALPVWLPKLRAHLESRARSLSLAADQVQHAFETDSVSVLGLSSGAKSLPPLLRRIAESERTTKSLQEQNANSLRKRPPPMDGM